MILIFYAIASGVGATPPSPPPWLCRCWSWFWWPSTPETVLFILPISFVPDWLALLLRLQLSCWPIIYHTIRFANFFAWPTIVEGLLPVHSDRIPHHWLYILSVYGQDVIVAWSPKQTGTLLSSVEVTAHRPKLRINLNAIIWLISWTNALPSEHRSYCLLPPPPPSRVVIIMMMIIIFFWPPSLSINRFNLRKNKKEAEEKV